MGGGNQTLNHASRNLVREPERPIRELVHGITNLTSLHVAHWCQRIAQ